MTHDYKRMCCYFKPCLIIISKHISRCLFHDLRYHLIARLSGYVWHSLIRPTACDKRIRQGIRKSMHSREQSHITFPTSKQWEPPPPPLNNHMAGSSNTHPVPCLEGSEMNKWKPELDHAVIDLCAIYDFEMSEEQSETKHICLVNVLAGRWRSRYCLKHSDCFHSDQQRWLTHS